MTILLPPYQFRDKCPWLLDADLLRPKLKQVPDNEINVYNKYENYNFSRMTWSWCKNKYSKIKLKRLFYKWLEINNIDFPKHRGADGYITTKLNYKKLYYLLNKNLG